MRHMMLNNEIGRRMEIGIIGTERIGLSLASAWLGVGHRVLIGRSSQDNDADLPEDLVRQAVFLSNKEVVDRAKILLFDFPWYLLTDRIREIGQEVDGVIIDAVNPLTSSGNLALGHSRSASELIAHEFPRAKVVKAFNHLHHTHIANPIFNGLPADAFYCSNHDDAKEIVNQLAGEIGLNPVDLGPLKHARYLEPLAMIWIQKAFHLGQGTEFTIKFLPRRS